MISASSWRFSVCSSPTLRISFARWPTVVVGTQSSWALYARPIASLRSASEIVGYSLTVSPVAGFTTA